MSNEKQSFFGHSKESQKEAIDRLDKFLDAKDLNSVKENVSYIERIAVLSLTMKRQLLNEFDLEYLGIVFKLSTANLLKGFLHDLSTSMKQEVLFSIQQEYKIGEVIDAQQRLVNWLRAQEKQGKISLCEVSNTTLV